MTPDELRATRARLTMTQAALAAALAVDVRTIKRWEAGTIPIPRTVELALSTLSA